MLFVDHKTRLVYPSFQASKTATEAFRSKCDYEKFAQRYNYSYHADNGAFRSETFQKDIDNKNQKLNFSGVNAQWQNGLVERSIGTLCAAARSMLSHAISKWDKTITPELWPFAIQQAATIYNTTKRLSRDYDVIRLQQFTGERSKLSQMTCTRYFVPSMCSTDACKRAHHPQMDNTHNSKGLCRPPSPLLQISSHGMGS
jgi:hypothetical protein